MAAIHDKSLQLAMQSKLFENFSKKEAGLAIDALDGELLSFMKGQTIYEKAGPIPGKHMLLILAGMVQLVRFGLHGERYLIDYSFAGSITGYVGSVSSRYLFDSSVIAGRDSVVLRLSVPDQKSLPADLKAKIEKNLRNILADRYTRLLQKADITTRRFVREKIITYLSYESQLRNSLSFEIPLNRQELADYLCVDRTTLSTELTRLQKAGILYTKRCHFELFESFLQAGNT